MTDPYKPPLRNHQMYAAVDFDAEYNNYPELQTSIGGANCVTSRDRSDWQQEQDALHNDQHFSLANRVHRVAIDIDLPVELYESSPGHHHLYIDRLITWRRYVVLLEAFAYAGIVEDGYVKASLDRGFTALRLPWVKKESEPF